MTVDEPSNVQRATKDMHVIDQQRDSIDIFSVKYCYLDGFQFIKHLDKSRICENTVGSKSLR